MLAGPTSGQTHTEWLELGTAPVMRTPSPSPGPQLRTPAEHADAIIARRRTKKGLPVKPRRSRSVGSWPREFEPPALAKPSHETSGADEMEVLADRSVPDGRSDLGHHVEAAQGDSRDQDTSRMASYDSSYMPPNREALKDRTVDYADIPSSPKKNLPSSPVHTSKARCGPRKSDMVCVALALSY